MNDNNPCSLQIDSDLMDHILSIQQKLLDADFDLIEFMNLTVNAMLTLTPATGAVIELAEGEDMVYRAATGSIKDNLGMHLKRKGSLTGLCVELRAVQSCTDTETDPRVNLEACRKVKARSIIVAPIFHVGNAIGVLKVISDQPNAFYDKDIQTLQLMAGFLGSALKNQILAEIRDFI